MKVTADVVAGIEYRILDEAGVEVDATPPGRPWFFLVGAQECPPGLERALLGKGPGERVSVRLPPEHTYGLRNESAVLELARASIPGPEPKVGMLLGIMSPKGETELRVVEVTEDTIVVDANHPLAGQTLTFEAAVAVVRRPSARELLDGEAQQSLTPAQLT